MVDATVSLDQVAQILGNKNVDTTRIYISHFAQKLQHEVGKVALV